MNKKSFVIGISMMLGAHAGFAQTGSLTKSDLQDIRSSYERDSYTKAMENALSNNDINDLAWNQSNLGHIDHNFKYRVDVSGITNQKSSGRCWLFTSLNVFRPEVMKKYDLSSFEFSQNHLYFWDLFEKSNLFLNNMIETSDRDIDDRLVRWYFRDPASDGGVWNLYVNLVQKYGLAPKEVVPETHSSENTRWMGKLLVTKLRENGLKLREMAANDAKPKALQAEKKEMLKDVYRMLCLNLGEPISEFEWRFKDKSGELSEYKTYTPESFRDEMIGDVNWNDHIMLMNDPSRPYYEFYEIENYRNVEEGINWRYINLPNEDIKKFAIESIKNNEAMYASCDVGKMLRRDHGVLDVNNFDYESVYGVEFGMDKKQRIESGESGSSHAMTLMAVDVDENGKSTKWQFENSWGAAAGHKGYLTFTDEWFDNYMFRVVIKKDYLDEKAKAVLKKEVKMLPPWDPMF